MLSWHPTGALCCPSILKGGKVERLTTGTVKQHVAYLMGLCLKRLVRLCEPPTRGQDLSVPAELEGVDGVRVAFKLSDHESMADVPEEHSTVCGPRGQKFPTRRESQCMNGPLRKTKKNPPSSATVTVKLVVFLYCGYEKIKESDKR